MVTLVSRGGYMLNEVLEGLPLVLTGVYIALRPKSVLTARIGRPSTPRRPYSRRELYMVVVLGVLLGLCGIIQIVDAF
jgi:hypothetical protein